MLESHEILFWADKIARQAIEEAKERNLDTVVCRSGQTPSGAKHIGNFNDNIRSYFVAKCIENLGFKSRHIQTHDDMDPLRKIPERVQDLEGKWHILNEEEIENMEKYIGFPLIKVPDPFGCCKNWALHFEKIWEDGCRKVGIKKTEYYRNEDLYKRGEFNPFIKTMFERIETVRDILLEHKTTKSEDYIPFWVICENCGRLTGKVIEFDLENKTVTYVCSERALAGKYKIPSCGYKSTTTWENGTGKLDWQLEWPAQMVMVNTIVEPFGKDHYEGSWPICREILPKVYNYKGIIPFVYEFFLIDGKKMSTRHGNVYVMQDMIKIMEPEIFCFLYTKRPTKQREISLKDMKLIDDFEYTERVYFGIEKAKNEHEEMNLKRQYELSWCDRDIPRQKPLRISYSVAAMIVQVIRDPEKRIDEALRLLEKIGHIKLPLSEEDKERVKVRLKLAKNWVERFAPENIRFDILPTLPNEIVEKLTERQKQALNEISERIKSKEYTTEELHAELYEIAKKYGLTSQEFFKAAYQILIGREYGPRLAPFLLSLDREFVIKRFSLKE
jgi:lysyl-tRNA synthetase class 1